MTKTFAAAILGMVLAVVLGGTAMAEDAAGDWIGLLDVSPAVKFHVALHVTAAGSGYAATIDSPDISHYDAPVTDLVVADGALSFFVPSSKGNYAGRFNAATGAWEGTWTINGRSWPLNFTHGVLPPRPTVTGLDGDWDGALQLGVGMKLRLAIHFKTGPHGTLGTMDSIDQNAMDVGLARIDRTESRVTFTIILVGASFQGTLDASGQSISGQWHQGGQDMPLVLTRRAEGQTQAVLKRPQTPVKPYPYREEDVGFDNAAAHARLAGTLTLPQGRGPFPAVILVAGSGPNTRDEPIMGHQLFLVIADHLTRHGIAVLRFDKRGTGASTGDYKAATTTDFADDALAAVAYLKTRKDIDPRHIGLIGHSEGGMIVPMVAVGDPSVAYIVMMAGPGVNGADVWIEQLRLILKAANVPDDTIAKALTVRRAMVDIVLAQKDPAAAAVKLRALLAGSGTPAQVDALIATVNTAWFRDFFAYDPQPMLRKVMCPVLALDGSKDLQVSAEQNLPAIRTALADNPNAQIIEMPNLNHLFQTATTGGIAEYAQIEETIAPVALDTMTDWIAKQNARP